MNLKENIGPVAIVIAVVAVVALVVFLAIQANKPGETNPNVVGKRPGYTQGGAVSQPPANIPGAQGGPPGGGGYRPGGMGR